MLAYAVERRQKVIEADFAHGAHLTLPGQPTEPLPEFDDMLGAMRVQIHRVQPKRGIQLTVGLDQIPHPLPVALINAQHHHALDTQRPTARQQRRAVGIEHREIEVGVGVDQLHAQA